MLQIYDESDPLNSTNLRKRLQKQVSVKEVTSQERGNVICSEKQVDEQPAGDKTTKEEKLSMEEKLKRETSESILEPLTEKLEDIAEKLDKERIEAEAKWEKSQRELEEVNGQTAVIDLLKMLFDDQMIRRERR